MTEENQARIRLSGTNLERAADHNQRITLHAIRVQGSLTRIDLAHITGLTPPAIANITKRLLAEGLIEEAGQRRGGRGQPPTKLVINRKACYAIGVNIDRDHVTIVIVDFQGQIVARTTREVDFALPEDVRALYQASIEQMVHDADIDRNRLVGIGVAVPDDLGLVDLPDRPAAYRAWEETDLRALFAAPFDLPVFVENDAAAAAMGELQFGRGQSYSSFFYVLISSGLGGGLVVDGNYFRGANGRSGELGFLLVEDGHGGRAQIQNFVSLSALAKSLERAGLRPVDICDSTSVAAGTVIGEWIEIAVDKLTEALIAVNCLINPAAILIGGRLPAKLVDALAAGLNAAMAERGANAPALAPVERAILAEDAPAVGAAILPFSHFLLPKPTALWKAPTSVQATAPSW